MKIPDPFVCVSFCVAGNTINIRGKTMANYKHGYHTPKHKMDRWIDMTAENENMINRWSTAYDVKIRSEIVRVHTGDGRRTMNITITVADVLDIESDV